MMSVPNILARLNADGIPAEQIDDVDAIAKRIARDAKENDVVLVMSSGAFGGVHEKILEQLAKSS
jgi:UDP-N-acetylmuramate: L-alanyl-gamma-D-glutamyl-meso-diaminopimelate ligase